MLASLRAAKNLLSVLLHKNYVLLVGALILLVASTLSWMASKRIDDFHQYHLSIAEKSTTGVEQQVAAFIAETKRTVSLFVEDHQDDLRAIIDSPNNLELHEAFGSMLTRQFPNRFAFSVADNKGVPVFEDFDGFISTSCLNDLASFAQENDDYHPYIHPNSEGYHFDVMVRFGEQDKEGIFFVSFLADVMGDILSSVQSLDHQVMLVLPGREDLIEVVAEGARNHRVRDDYRLSKEEKARINLRKPVRKTRWQVIDLYRPGLHTNYMGRVLLESVLAFLVFTTVAITLVVRLRREERQREFAEQQKQALMGVITHEFRSPTTVIKGTLDAIHGGLLGDVSPELKTFVKRAQDNTSRLLTLIGDFLDIQKMESGNLSLSLQSLSISQVVREAVVSNAMYAEQFGVKFVIEEPQPDAVVNIDQERIQQVLTNLLSNAAKYGAKNDTISISVEKRARHIRVKIMDHGVGIAEEFKPKVFEKFAMAMAVERDAKVQSSGLGLSIAKAIIEQHDGIIGFDTVTEANVKSAGATATGTTFWFMLPLVFNS